MLENGSNFYKKMDVPVPLFCPECRHVTRLKKRGPNKLWHRKCMKEECQNEFETSYAPDPRYAEGSGEARRPEIVYCEKCYQQEVY